MLAIDVTREAARTVRRLPLVMIIGLLAMALAGVLDVVVHLGSVGSSGHVGHHGVVPEHLAHLVGVAGMVLVLAGVVIDGLRRQLRQRAARNGGFDRDAHR